MILHLKAISPTHCDFDWDTERRMFKNYSPYGSRPDAWRPSASGNDMQFALDRGTHIIDDVQWPSVDDGL